jgi:exodeoxyribonuclease VII large subunit
LEALRLDRQLGESWARLDRLSSLLDQAERARLVAARQRLSRSTTQLEALSPLSVLGRGYSLAWSESGGLLRDARGVRTGDKIRVTLHRGELDCRVENTRPEGGENDR